jgi:hypothetical protein
MPSVLSHLPLDAAGTSIGHNLVAHILRNVQDEEPNRMRHGESAMDILRFENQKITCVEPEQVTVHPVVRTIDEVEDLVEISVVVPFFREPGRVLDEQDGSAFHRQINGKADQTPDTAPVRARARFNVRTVNDTHSEDPFSRFLGA